MCVNDDTGSAISKRESPRVLLETDLHDNKGREDPSIQIATPQVRQSPCSHDPV